jgi:LemA protein
MFHFKHFARKGARDSSPEATYYLVAFLRGSHIQYAVYSLAAIVAIWAIVVFNQFVALRARMRNAFADVDVQLTRRHNLIPNLVETVKGYAAHEKGVFEDVALLRSGAMGAQGVASKGEAETKLQGAIRNLFAVAEAYPDLRADKNFRHLQTQLAEVEDNLQYARRYYNAVVRDLNTKLEQFPALIIGSLFGFRRGDYFQAEDAARMPPNVELN